MLYDYTGVHIGWKPYVQFDYTYDEDTLLYGYDISGPDPLAPWIDLGSNTGIKHSLTDLNVYPYAEYCYVITAYDTGIPSGYISDDGLLYEEGYASLESDFHNMVCLSPIVPDFYTPPTENIFIKNDTNIGWSQINYIPHSVDTVNTGLYKFEIQAEIDSSTYLLSKTLNPKLFVYEVDEDDAKISDYLIEGFPIYPIDEEALDSTAWLDILGMYVKIENFYSTHTDPLALVKMETAVFSDTTLSDRIDIKMKWDNLNDLSWERVETGYCGESACSAQVDSFGLYSVVVGGLGCTQGPDEFDAPCLEAHRSPLYKRQGHSQQEAT